MFLTLGALLTIILLYFAFALVFLPLFSKKICAICAAVGLTWLGLLIGYLVGWHSDTILIGILMGGSVIGVMYRAERYFRAKQLANFWFIKLYIVIVGFLGVYLLLSRRFDSLIVMIAFAVITGFLSLFFIKSKNSGLTADDKLEHCCD